MLQSLVLESGDAAGLASGTRTIGVTLTDVAGSVSTPHSAALIIDEMKREEVSGQTFVGTAASEPVMDGSGADTFVLSLNDGRDIIEGEGVAWTDQIEATGTMAPDEGAWPFVADNSAVTGLVQNQAITFDQVMSGHIEFTDGTQTDLSHLERVTWF